MFANLGLNREIKCRRIRAIKLNRKYKCRKIFKNMAKTQTFMSPNPMYMPKLPRNLSSYI